jgi:hypothetical protein
MVTGRTGTEMMTTTTTITITVVVFPSASSRTGIPVEAITALDTRITRTTTTITTTRTTVTRTTITRTTAIIPAGTDQLASRR